MRAEAVMMQQLTLEAKEGSEGRRLYGREFPCRVVPELIKPQQNSREQRGRCPIHHPLYCSEIFLLGHGQLLMPNSQTNRKILKHLSQQLYCMPLPLEFLWVYHNSTFLFLSYFILPHCPSASWYTYLQGLFCHTARSLPFSVPFPSLLIPLHRFQFGVTFSQISPACHWGQLTASRVTACLRNEEKLPLLSQPSASSAKPLPPKRQRVKVRGSLKG